MRSVGVMAAVDILRMRFASILICLNCEYSKIWQLPSKFVIWSFIWSIIVVRHCSFTTSSFKMELKHCLICNTLWLEISIKFTDRVLLWRPVAKTLDSVSHHRIQLVHEPAAQQGTTTDFSHKDHSKQPPANNKMSYQLVFKDTQILKNSLIWLNLATKRILLWFCDGIVGS